MAPDLLGYRAIDLEARRDKNEFGTLPERRCGRHCRAHAERAGFVTCSRDHTAFGGMADRDGPPTKAWIIPLLDRRIEGVHVDVDDFTVDWPMTNSSTGTKARHAEPASRRRRSTAKTRSRG